MATAFITGGSGFIGRRLIGRLVADGHAVRALARSDRAASRIRERGGEPVAGDLSDMDAMRSGAEGCEWAFHSAANIRDWGIPADFERDNVQGTRNVLRVCAQAGVRRFVHVGTEAVLLAGEPLINVDETAPLRPDSPALYSSSKARAEQFVLDADREGFETVVVRPRFVWGPEDTTLLLRMVDLVRSNRFAWIGGGRQLMSTTHVDNLVECLVLAARHPAAPGNAYFVTDGDPVAFREFVSELLMTQGVDPPTRSIPRPVAAIMARLGEAAWRALPLPGRPPLSRFAYWVTSQECTLNDAKARRELGYRPVTSRADGVAELRSLASSVATTKV